MYKDKEENKRWLKKVNNALEKYDDLTLGELLEWLGGYEENMDKQVRITYDTGYGTVGVKRKCLKITEDKIIILGD